MRSSIITTTSVFTLRLKAIRRQKLVVHPKTDKPTWSITAGKRIAAGLSSFQWRRDYDFETHTRASELIELMETPLAQHPEVRIFSLPRFLDNGWQRLELGVKGERQAVKRAFEELKLALTPIKKQVKD